MSFKWTIDKSFSFEMGHRVHSQRLDHPHLSISTECACKHLHGHSYEIRVFLGADELDNTQMVVDFKNLNFMKEFLDKHLDHKFMIDINDPLFKRITGVSFYSHSEFYNNTFNNFTNLGDVLRDNVNRTGLDVIWDSFVLVNFVPTSENICKYLFKYAQEKIGSVAKVTAVELWETKKSHCRYEE